MKKIYSLFMAFSIALCAMANSPYTVENQLAISTPKVVKKLNPANATTQSVGKQTKMNQQDRAAIAAKRMAAKTPAVKVDGVRQVEAANTIAKQAIPVANNKKMADAQATETVVIAAATWQWEYYASDNDWYTYLADATGTYEIYLDYISTTQAGTFTEADLIADYSGMYIYDGAGGREIVTFTEANITVTDDANGLALSAELLGSNNVLYLVSAFIAPLPEAKDTVELAYSTATLVDGTRSSETFQFWADENGVYTSFLIASGQVEGEYTEKDMYVSYANYIMFVDGTDTTFVDFIGLNLTITKEARTYFADAYALGADTTMYHITMSYTIPEPTDTIDIVATNMVIDEFEFWGMYFCTITASNDDYNITLDMVNGLPVGELTSADFNIDWSYLTRVSDMTEIAFNDITATVTSVDGQRAIKAEALGVDNIIYNLDLSYVLPTAADTVDIVFTTPATAEYYDSYGDYYIYNENEEYIVTLDIFTEPNVLEGEYKGEDFDLYYTQVGLIVDGDTTGVAVAAAEAVATVVSEGLVHIDAELLCENGVLYMVSTDVTMQKAGLQYDMQEGSVNREYNLNDELTITTDYVADYGELYVDVMAGDMSDLMSLLFFVNDTVEGLVIPAGTYPISDTYTEGTVLASTGYNSTYGAMPSNYCTLVEEEGTLYLDELFFMVGGNVVVEHVDGHVKITVEAVNSYDVPAHIVYEAVEGGKVTLNYDSEEGAVDRSYTTEEITIKKGTGYFQVLAYAADGTDMTALLLFGQEDENTIIPVGTYEINGTQDDGTVLASNGVNLQNQITLSFYGKTNNEGNILVPCWFFVGGTVKVSATNETLKIEVNAVNSYDVPVHVIMEYDLNTKQGLQYDMQEGSVNRIYTSEDQAEFDTDYVETYGQLYFEVMGADMSDVMSLVFFVNETAEGTVLPVGTYPITNTGAAGTAYASTGYDSNSGAMPCYYSTLIEDGGYLYLNELYFMVSGNIVAENVDGYLKLTIDALNSYDVPAHIEYSAAPEGTGVDNVVAGDDNAQKVVENSQLFIIKEGVKYNVLGSVVK